MQRINDYRAKMIEVMRERAAEVGPVIQTDVPWGGFRAERNEPSAPTTEEWIAKMTRAMYDDDSIAGGDWSQLYG